MKFLALAFAAVSAWGSSSAQGLTVGIAYEYLYANQWDKAIQTYNFSRPFLAQQQPLFIHGLNASASYLFPSTKRFAHGIELSYSRFGSTSENEGFENTLTLNLLSLGYILHVENPWKCKALYADLMLSARASGLFRKVNGDPFEYDDERSKAYGIGGELGVRIGYKLSVQHSNWLSPFIALAYTPYLYAPNTEAVINQTKGLASRDWTGITTAQVGLAVHFRRAKEVIQPLPLD